MNIHLGILCINLLTIDVFPSVSLANLSNKTAQPWTTKNNAFFHPNFPHKYMMIRPCIRPLATKVARTPTACRRGECWRLPHDATLECLINVPAMHQTLCQITKKKMVPWCKLRYSTLPQGDNTNWIPLLDRQTARLFYIWNKSTIRTVWLGDINIWGERMQFMLTLLNETHVVSLSNLASCGSIRRNVWSLSDWIVEGYRTLLGILLIVLLKHFLLIIVNFRTGL